MCTDREFKIGGQTLRFPDRRLTLWCSSFRQLFIDDMSLHGRQAGDPCCPCRSGADGETSEDQPVDDAPRPRRRQGRFRRRELLTFCFSNPAAAHWPRLQDKKPISWQPWRCYLSPPSHHAGMALFSSRGARWGWAGKNLSCDAFLIPDPGCRTTRLLTNATLGGPGRQRRSRLVAYAQVLMVVGVRDGSAVVPRRGRAQTLLFQRGRAERPVVEVCIWVLPKATGRQDEFARLREVEAQTVLRHRSSISRWTPRTRPGWPEVVWKGPHGNRLERGNAMHRYAFRYYPPASIGYTCRQF